MINRNDLGKLLKQLRLMIPMTRRELSAATGISAQYLGRIERGKRFPSAHTLRKIDRPLGFAEDELLTFAGLVSPKHSKEAESKAQLGRLDPFVAAALSREPVEIQRTFFAILTVLKSVAKGSGSNIGFAEYVHRNYPEVDEDIITMVEDILEHPTGEH